MPHEKQGALVRREDLFPAHRKLEGFSRKQPDMGHRTTRGEAATPPSIEQHDLVLCFSPV